MKEFNKWDSQPRNLTNEEIADPMRVLNEVFDYAHLPDLRNVLWEWLKTTVSGNYSKSLHYKDRESLLYFYEKMQKLLEAAHLLLVAKKLAVPSTKETTEVDKENDTKQYEIAPAAELIPVIENLVKLLAPEFIFEMGKTQELNGTAPVYYFLVVLPNDDQRSYAECQALVETACSVNGIVQLRSVKTIELQRFLQDGHLLYSSLCTDDKLVYAKNSYTLPTADNTKLPQLVAASREEFDITLLKAQAFYDGAIFYLSQSNYSLAIFMLQQAVEHTLRGFLQAVSGRNYIGHDLEILRRHCLPFYQELITILPVELNREICLLHRLGKAYVQARYQSNFAMSVAEINTIKEWVEQLLPTTKRVYEHRMENVLAIMSQ